MPDITVGEVRRTAGDAPAGSAEAAGGLILIVEDESLVRETIAAGLERAGFVTVSVGSAEAMLTLMEARDFDLVLLDVGLPGMSGFEACDRIRDAGDTPVIFVTAAADLTERLRGFDLGADDYVVKPVKLPELVRRTTAVLRRVQAPAREPDDLRGPEGILVRTQRREVFVKGRRAELSTLQFDVLEELLRNRGRVCTAEQIALAVWGHETGGSWGFVEGQVSRVRIALRTAGASGVIERVRGVGWVIR